jgi:hypothetical protein
MKKIITSIFVLTALTVFAQTEDMVETAGGVNDVYYSFNSKTKTPVSRTTWDIGLTTNPQSASIIINENGGTELYLYGNDTSKWSSLDTAGMKWTNIYNSETTWASGAFANQGTTHPDYGWGMYNMTTHDIVGNRIFILKNTAGEYWKVMIPVMKAAGDFSVRIAKLSGASETTYTFNKNDYKAKHFHMIPVSDVPMSITTNPNKEDWDILFTKYITYVNQGPNSRFQPVGGVKVNIGCEVAQRDGIATTSDDTASLAWNTDITEIGWDWKTFDFGSSSYFMEIDRTYFIRTPKGAVWKLWFTDYTVGTANYSFNTKLLTAAAGTNELVKLNTAVYPNPTNGVLTISNKENTNLTLSLMNAQGMVVVKDNVAAHANLNIATTDLAKGVYFLELNTANASQTQRVIFE